MVKSVRPVVSIAALCAAIGLLVACNQRPADDEKTAERIQPVAHVALADAAPAAPAGPRSGEDIVKTVCSACHTTGASNSPKIGDKAAWAPRIATGFDALLKSALNGKNLMPAKGGDTSLSDYELASAVTYLANQGGANFKAPAAPAGGKATPAPTASAESAPAADAAKKEEKTTVAAAGGEDVFKSKCFACHATGAAGAPKVGDKAAWAPRIAQGMDTLHKHALEGIRLMQPKGGFADLSDAEVKAAVDYMVAQEK